MTLHRSRRHKRFVGGVDGPLLVQALLAVAVGRKRNHTGGPLQSESGRGRDAIASIEEARLTDLDLVGALEVVQV